MGSAMRLVSSLPTMVRGLINPSLMSHKTIESRLSDPARIEDPNQGVPTAEKPVTMPDQQEIEQNQKRSLISQRMQRGRASTILTDTNDKLGG